MILLLLVIAIAIAVVVLAGTIGFVVVRSRRHAAPEPRGIAVELPPPAPPPRAAAPAAPAEAEVEVEVAEPEVEVAEPAIAEPVEVEVEVAERPRLRDRLGRTRAAFSRVLAGRGGIDQDVWDDLEEALILADVGSATASRLLASVQAAAREQNVTDAEQLGGLVRAAVVELLAATPERGLDLVVGEPNVWMFVGVNGVGKTTTIAKLAAQQVGDGRRVLLAAADTFRAAAAEQLTMWGERVGAETVRGQEGADPGSVVFDAMSAASGRGVDLVLIDTAGRLHTKVNLMEELKKLRRIVDRTPGSLKEVLLVIDATTGQNGLTQARQFAEAVAVTGIVLTKLDGSAKGGIVLAIQSELGLPVKVVGVGEGVEDLVPFDAAEFAAALFDT
ncbi:MAG TPA: signal recognition particle-docking protein FtsY [Acidimicrobiia bacterium]